MPIDFDRIAGFLRGAADMCESQEKRREFKAKFGEAAARTVFEQLRRRGIDPQLLELIRKDLDL